MLDTIERALDREPERDAIQAKLESNPFVVGYKKKIGLIAVSLLLALTSLVVFYVSAKRIKPPDLFFLQEDGSVSKIQVDTLPNQSRQAVANWAREAVQKAYTIDFLNWSTAIDSAQPYFTSDAWPVFRRTMENSPLLAEVRKNTLNVSVVIKTEPIFAGSIRERGGEEFAWRFVIPATVIYYGDAQPKIEDYVFRVTVVRVPTTENPKGLGVLQMTTGPLPKK